MTSLSIVLLVTVSAVEASCPYQGASLGSSVRTFYLTSGVYDDTEELERESKQDSDPISTEKVQRTCGVTVTCDTNQTYRTFDGTCNNVKKPAAGSRGQCYKRILPASYVDGISEPLKRAPISEIFNALQSRPKVVPRRQFNTMFAMISQFLVHDLMKTALSRLENDFDCCSPENCDLPKCAMRIDTGDAVPYKNHSISCMSFVRAARCPCSQGRTRESMNLETAYLDLSHVYLDGSNRLPNTPFLRTSFSNFSGALPQLDPEPPVCYADRKLCFKGDHRMNQQQGISLHHIVFERQHNFIARNLSELNPSWTTEVVFQEARKILIARWQYVYCNEVITRTIDEKLLKDAGIHLDQLMDGTKVDPDAETNILTESVHAELRIHQTAPETIGDHELLWLNSGKYFTDERFLSNLLEGQLYEPRNPAIPMVPKLAHEALKDSSDPVGLSMLMINIQRGRDTGVPGFRDLLAWAHNVSIRSFDDIAKLDVMENEDLKFLQTIYSKVEDIDMWVGIRMLKSYGQGVAYASQRIRLLQHYGHVKGDRFFFSHKGVFTQKQREAISKSSSYAQMLCEVMDLKVIQADAFAYDENVTKIPCSDFAKFDFKLWQELSM